MFLFACMLTCLLSVQLAPSPTIPQVQTDPARPNWMQTDKALQLPVTLEAKGRSLRVLLSALSKQSGVSIQAERDIQEFRVSINVRSQPLCKIMARVEDLFGHGRVPSSSCVWQRGQSNGQPPSYLLVRTPRGREEEEALRNVSLRTALRRLHEMRDYEQMSPEQRRNFKSDVRDIQTRASEGRSLGDNQERLIWKVLGGLTDAQFKTLTDSGTVDVPQFILAPEAAAWLLQKVPHTDSPLADNQDTRTPLEAALTFAASPSWKGIYNVSLTFHSGYPRTFPYSIGVDTYSLFESPQTVEDDTATSGPVVDLLDGEKVPQGKQAITSLPNALNILAHKANINIYAETFIHPQQALRFTKGSTSYLLTHLCTDFGCRWLKVGNDYLVYSKSWAQDRFNNVPQPSLERWAAKRAKQGRYELADYIEMTRLNDGQLENVVHVLAIQGPFGANNQHAIRLLNAIGDGGVVGAYSPQGASVAFDPSTQQEDWEAVFNKRPVAPPVRVLLEASKKGIGIQYADQKGKSRWFWAYQGEQPRDVPSSSQPRIESDGSYIPFWFIR